MGDLFVGRRGRVGISYFGGSQDSTAANLIVRPHLGSVWCMFYILFFYFILFHNLYGEHGASTSRRHNVTQSTDKMYVFFERSDPDER